MLKQIRFFLEGWLDESPLEDTFPHLYSNVINQEAAITKTRSKMQGSQGSEGISMSRS